MGELHDAYASMYGNKILSKIRNSDDEFKQIFSTSITRVGDWDWPRPDYVCYDEELRASYALEFKPPFQTKREYLTGFGQSIAYLQKHLYSGLIVPFVADDGFRIADFICDSMKSSELVNLHSSLYAYDYESENIFLLKPITNQRTDKSIITKYDSEKTFWCWWRDISHYELYDLLNLSFLFSEKEGDIYSEYIYPTFYQMMVDKRTKQWNGLPRNKKGSEASKKSEKQNYKIPLVQLELWSRSEGRLTSLGLELLELGKKYGPNSKRFLNRLSFLLLVNGRHLDLINLVDDFQKISTVSNSSKDYTVALENFLSDNGCIGKRKPNAKTTNAKNSYMRDEMKLWNKLGLLYARNNTSYFFPGEGYKFNWKKITDILISGNK